MQLIACASSLPTESCRTFRVSDMSFGERGIVLETTTSSSAEPSIRSAAAPENRPCVAKAKTRRAPSEVSSLAAVQSVPAAEQNAERESARQKV